MTPANSALSIVLALIGVAATFYIWVKLAGRGHEAWRRRCERRYNVTIDIGGKGHWEIRNGGLRGFAIELLQLGFYMALFALWGLVMIVIVAIGKLAS